MFLKWEHLFWLSRSSNHLTQNQKPVSDIQPSTLAKPNTTNPAQSPLFSSCLTNPAMNPSKLHLFPWKAFPLPLNVIQSDSEVQQQIYIHIAPWWPLPTKLLECWYKFKQFHTECGYINTGPSSPLIIKERCKKLENFTFLTARNIYLKLWQEYSTLLTRRQV